MTFDPESLRGERSARRVRSGTTGSRCSRDLSRSPRSRNRASRILRDGPCDGLFDRLPGHLCVISTLAGKGDYVILDIDSHASIYDGCAMGNAEIVPFRHNDVSALERRLARVPEGAGKLVVLEGVYSMLGDVAPLKEMVAVCKANGAMVLVDEAHSMGFIGENAAGSRAPGDRRSPLALSRVRRTSRFCVSNHPKSTFLRLVCRPMCSRVASARVATAATSFRS